MNTHTSPTRNTKERSSLQGQIRSENMNERKIIDRSLEAPEREKSHPHDGPESLGIVGDDFYLRRRRRFVADSFMYDQEQSAHERSGMAFLFSINSSPSFPGDGNSLFFCRTGECWLDVVEFGGRRHDLCLLGALIQTKPLMNRIGEN